MTDSIHSFPVGDRGVLVSKGYLIGYDIECQPRPDQAVHPETGIIITVSEDADGDTYFHMWHPGINRSDARSRYSLDTLLLHVSNIKKLNSYSDWHRYSRSQTQLYRLYARKLSQRVA
jgi:hypothetical protein